MGRSVRSCVVICAVAVLVGASACSSSKSGASPKSPSSTTVVPTGTPVKAVAITDTSLGQTATDVLEGIKVGVQAVNAAGGINGHPLEVSTCTDTGDANEAAACARNAASDPSVLAVVGGYTSYGASVDPILQASGTANVGNAEGNPTDIACSVCFNSAASYLSTAGSALAAVKLLNAKRVGVPYIDTAGGASIAPTLAPELTPFGAQTVGVVPIATTAADVTPQAAAEGAANPDVIIDALTTELYTKFIHAYRQQGFQTPFVISGGVFDAHGIQTQLSGANNNIYVDLYFNHDSPGYNTFTADMNKYAASYPDRTDVVLQGYFAAKELAYAAKHASSLTKAGILSEMNSLKNYDSDGLLPPLDYTTPQTGLGGKAPRVFADHIWLYKYDNGQFVKVGAGSAINIFTGGA
ncbi:MAG: ABC transporter substrate-binding protein [Acidimicrobiales bacterium]|nr:ABC transporter substrate-binding protein [Acidimicrobiales bacterium]